MRSGRSLVVLVALLSVAPVLLVAGQGKAAPKSAAAFDPRDLAGMWMGEQNLPGYRGLASYDQTIPEPPLTTWAKENLLYKSISHDALAGKRIREATPKLPCPDNQHPCFSEDQYGVPANDPNGEYPAKDCEPLSTPAMYDYPYMGSMELLPTADGRFFQFFEYHREWRTFWVNREHPKDLIPSYEGHSVAHWDGNTLVVDTIGYNDKTMVTQNVGHRKSEEFHLVERFHLVDHNHLQIDMTYADTLAWGDKVWPGFRKLYRRIGAEDFQEFICSPRDYVEYNATVGDKLNAPGK